MTFSFVPHRIISSLNWSQSPFQNYHKTPILLAQKDIKSPFAAKYPFSLLSDFTDHRVTGLILKTLVRDLKPYIDYSYAEYDCEFLEEESVSFGVVNLI